MRMLVAMVVVVRVLVPALFLLLVPLTTTWAAGGLSVTTPNGGQKWTIGKQYAIKWRKGTAGTSVRISLTKSGRHYQWISKKTRNDGRYTWKIPTSVAAGSAYKVKIKSVKKKRVLDSSNRYFTIKKKKTGGGGFTISGARVTCAYYAIDVFDYARLRVTGNLRNRFNVKAGAKLQLNVYAGSRLLATKTFNVPFLAACCELIGPKRTYTFDEAWPYEDYSDLCVPMTRTTLKIVNTYF